MKMASNVLWPEEEDESILEIIGKLGMDFVLDPQIFTHWGAARARNITRFRKLYQEILNQPGMTKSRARSLTRDKIKAEREAAKVAEKAQEEAHNAALERAKNILE